MALRTRSRISRSTTSSAAPTNCAPISFALIPATRASDRTTTIVNEGLAKWTYNGQEGYGISEYLHQLDADAKPIIPIEGPRRLVYVWCYGAPGEETIVERDRAELTLSS